MMINKQLQLEEDEPRSDDAEERRDEDDFKEHDLGWEEGDPADRRRDPMRKP